MWNEISIIFGMRFPHYAERSFHICGKCNLLVSDGYFIYAFRLMYWYPFEK